MYRRPSTTCPTCGCSLSTAPAGQGKHARRASSQGFARRDGVRAPLDVRIALQPGRSEPWVRYASPTDAPAKLLPGGYYLWEFVLRLHGFQQAQ